jgi:hypothetical protein
VRKLQIVYISIRMREDSWQIWKLVKGEVEVTRRRKKLLDDLKDRRGYSHLKEEALDRTMWRNRFGGSFGPVVRQNTE